MPKELILIREARSSGHLVASTGTLRFLSKNGTDHVSENVLENAYVLTLRIWILEFDIGRYDLVF